MLQVVTDCNRILLDQINRLAGCDEVWRNRVLKEFGLSESQLDMIQEVLGNDGLRTRQVIMQKTRVSSCLFTISSSEIQRALTSAESMVTYPANHRMSNEYCMAVQKFVGSLKEACRENPKVAAMRFGLNREVIDMIDRYDSYDISNALIMLGVPFKPTNTLTAVFMASNNVERKHCLLKDIAELMKANNFQDLVRF